MIPGVAPPSAAGKDLHWLLRYARHGQVQLDLRVPEANALKSCFTPAGWRLLCRSDRDHFIPILRNRRLCFDSLVHYTQTLVEHGFQVAPSPHLLGYLIQASYYFFDRMPEVPHSQDEMTLLRLATRHGAVARNHFQWVHEWQAADHACVSTRLTWFSVLRRANGWHVRQQLVVNRAKAGNRNADPEYGWHFACGTLAWRGFEISPLANDIDLWDEGQAMSSCLYRLRNLCKSARKPSRFFSVTKNGRRHATLELVRDPPHERMHGPDRIHGQWRLQDCRLSHNRLPSEDLVKMLIDFGWHYNNLSQRPGRAPRAARPTCTVRINPRKPNVPKPMSLPARSPLHYQEERL
jgi:hypothetical protein